MSEFDYFVEKPEECNCKQVLSLKKEIATKERDYKVMYNLNKGLEEELKVKKLNKTSQLKDNQNNSFEEALMPAIEYLKGQHPHLSIIVTSLHAELLEGVKVINEKGKL